MNPNPISFGQPIERGWQRMIRQLFRPFNLKHWFVLGFTSFLAGLSSCGSNGFGGSDGSGSGIAGTGRRISNAWESFLAFEFWIGLIALIIFVVVGLILMILFVSSRGKFVFLDNVLGERALVVDPWQRFSRLGNSLFGLKIVLTLICIAGFAVLVSLLVVLGIAADGLDQEWVTLVPMLVVAALTVLAVVVVLYATFFLDAFVVPLMHRYDLDAVEACRRFLDLFNLRPLPFLVCGFAFLIAAVGVFFAIVTFGLLTCCLGFLLLMIPYISSVVLLPVAVFYRAFTVEFLAQFDGELLAGTESSEGGIRVR